MAKKIGETAALVVYGPYPDKKVSDKWMVNVVDPSRGKDYKVVFFGSDTYPVFTKLRAALLKRMASRAGKP